MNKIIHTSSKIFKKKKLKTYKLSLKFIKTIVLLLCLSLKKSIFIFKNKKKTQIDYNTCPLKGILLIIILCNIIQHYNKILYTCMCDSFLES